MNRNKHLKRITGIMLSCVLLLAGCSAGTASLFSKPGTYTATEKGRNGDVKVTATFSSSEVTKIDIDSQETETIGVPAMDTIKEKILNQQTLDVDTVAGATISSNALLTAMNDLVGQAGGDASKMTGKAAASSSAASYVTDADVIVVGAGGAGLTAALTAYEDGASVVLLEKSSTVGGNTLCAVSGINAAGSKVQETLGSAATTDEFKTVQMNNADAKENLVDTLVNTSGKVIDWLASLGVNFTMKKQDSSQQAKAGDDLSLQATDKGTTTQTLINAIYNKVKESKVNLYLNMDVTTLLTDSSNTVTGVKATAEDGSTVSFNGKEVILATGGYGQSEELVSEYAPAMANATTDEIAPTTGEGLQMAMNLDAETVNLDALQKFPHVVTGYGMITPNNLPGGFTPSAIYVNNQGDRFTAEKFTADDAVLAQDKGEAFCIFPEEYLNDTMKTLYSSGYAVKADNVEDLAKQLGIDASELQKTVDQWNQDVDAGTDSKFGRTDNLVKLTGTLYAYKFGVGVHYCMGGVLINESSQVVKKDGSAIKGLYAAGEVTGGVHGTYRVDGTGVTDSFVFGYIAGHTAAKAAK